MSSPYHQAPVVDPALLDTRAPKDSPAFTGQIKAADGTAAAPGVTFTADTDTGLHRPASNALSLATGGTERLRVGADGTVSLAGAPGSESVWVWAATGGVNYWGMVGRSSGNGR